MSVHTAVHKEGIYFITFTCFNWLYLIGLTNSYDLVYNWFNHLNKSGQSVPGYVIMPNHVHLLLQYANTGQPLNTVVGNGKRFIGYELVKRLKAKREVDVLAKMQEAVRIKDRQRAKKHQVWQGTFDVKECRTEKFTFQKLQYMHNNPCMERWQLCSRPVEYVHSSAGQYDVGRVGCYSIKDYRQALIEVMSSGKQE